MPAARRSQPAGRGMRDSPRGRQILLTQPRLLVRHCHVQHAALTSLRCRFQDMPRVTGQPHLRFYAAVALRCSSGTLGSLCIADHKPRTFTPDQFDFLLRCAGVCSARWVVAALTAAHVVWSGQGCQGDLGGSECQRHTAPRGSSLGSAVTCWLRSDHHEHHHGRSGGSAGAAAAAAAAAATARFWAKPTGSSQQH